MTGSGVLLEMSRRGATNLLGPIRLTSALLPQLQEQARATVITVSSGLGFVPLAMTPTYSATKAAIHSYSQSLRYQLKDTPVEVIAIIPPYVQSALMGEQQANDPQAMPLDEFIADFAVRPGHAGELDRAERFLLELDRLGRARTNQMRRNSVHSVRDRLHTGFCRFFFGG